MQRLLRAGLPVLSSALSHPKVLLLVVRSRELAPCVTDSSQEVLLPRQDLAE